MGKRSCFEIDDDLQVPFSYTVKQGMLLGDSAYGFCLWETVTYLLVLIVNFLLITSR